MLAIDPGNTQSGWCIFDGQRVIESGVLPNDEMLSKIEQCGCKELAIEMIASYGMAVGKDVFETCVWVGRFYQLWSETNGREPFLVYRKDVKMHLCHTMKAKDANIRQAIIDSFPATGGGKIPQVGTKAKPGPLYGVSSHAWAALGVALTAKAEAVLKVRAA